MTYISMGTWYQLFSGAINIFGTASFLHDIVSTMAIDICDSLSSVVKSKKYIGLLVCMIAMSRVEGSDIFCTWNDKKIFLLNISTVILSNTKSLMYTQV